MEKNIREYINLVEDDNKGYSFDEKWDNYLGDKYHVIELLRKLKDNLYSMAEEHGQELMRKDNWNITKDVRMLEQVINILDKDTPKL